MIGSDGYVRERLLLEGAVPYSDNVVRNQFENIGSTDIKVLIAEYK